MWWEMFPGLVLITGLLTVSGSVAYYGEKFRNGGKAQRPMKSGFDWHLKKRDEKLAGRWCGVKGLEYLPQKSS